MGKAQDANRIKFQLSDLNEMQTTSLASTGRWARSASFETGTSVLSSAWRLNSRLFRLRAIEGHVPRVQRDGGGGAARAQTGWRCNFVPPYRAESPHFFSALPKADLKLYVPCTVWCLKEVSPRLEHSCCASDLLVEEVSV